jgi:hypothetical protein
MEMNMQIIMAILFLAVLMWVEAAHAQSTYSVSVSRHSATDPLSNEDVREILDKASKMLQKGSSHVDDDLNVACNVTFTLKGPVSTFASPNTPAIIENADHRDAVHKDGAGSDLDGVPFNDMGGVHFRIKVVKEIRFCRRGLTSTLFYGCAFPAEFRSIIVVHPKMLINPDNPNPSGPFLTDFPYHLLWPHEFGHLTGLGHRNDEQALMTACYLKDVFSGVPDAQVRVNRNECSCLRSGPGSCLPLPRARGC